MCTQSQLLVCVVSDTVRIQLEKGLAKARNKRLNSKQYEKHLKMHHWQKDGDRMYVLRDYKTYYLVIVLNKQDMYECSFSGAKMSKYTEFVNKSFSDVYSNLTDAKNSVIEFMDLYVEALYKMNQVRLEQYKQKRKETS
jgi:hypothetical protein